MTNILCSLLRHTWIPCSRITVRQRIYKERGLLDSRSSTVWDVRIHSSISHSEAKLLTEQVDWSATILRRKHKWNVQEDCSRTIDIPKPRYRTRRSSRSFDPSPRPWPPTSSRRQRSRRNQGAPFLLKHWLAQTSAEEVWAYFQTKRGTYISFCDLVSVD